MSPNHSDWKIYIRKYQLKYPCCCYTYRYYTGITNDMDKRQSDHSKGLCKTTKDYNKHMNLLIIYQTKANYTKEIARHKEKIIKRYTQKKKEKFIINYMEEW